MPLFRIHRIHPICADRASLLTHVGRKGLGCAPIHAREKSAAEFMLLQRLDISTVGNNCAVKFVVITCIVPSPFLGIALPNILGSENSKFHNGRFSVCRKYMCALRKEKSNLHVDAAEQDVSLSKIHALADLRQRDFISASKQLR